MHRRFLLFPFLLAAAATCPAFAQELNLFGGTLRDTSRHKSAHAVEAEYMQGVGSHSAFSLGYLNEGHLPDDHRDGYLAQFWGRTDVLDRKLTLSAGIGPYWYLDTNQRTPGSGFTDNHGWGRIMSLDAAWHAGDRWLIRARGNWVNASSSFDSSSLSLGVGYSLSSDWCAAPRAEAPQCPEWTTGRELTLYGGTDVVNSFGNTGSAAVEGLEYRRGFARNADWTVGLFHENHRLLARRTSLATEVWVTRPVSGEDWRLGLGAGPYFVIGKGNRAASGETNPQSVCGVISATASRRLSDKWSLRLTWDRVFTNDDRDTDMVMLGLGYRLSEPNP
jgi:hypothetical protein